jgi:hypothetical protein
MERFIEMEGLSKTLHDLGSELGIERVHLTRFSRGEIDNEKGNNGDEEESDDFLDYASTNERKHEISWNT